MKAKEFLFATALLTKKFKGVAQSSTAHGKALHYIAFATWEDLEAWHIAASSLLEGDMPELIKGLSSAPRVYFGPALSRVWVVLNYLRPPRVRTVLYATDSNTVFLGWKSGRAVSKDRCHATREEAMAHWRELHAHQLCELRLKCKVLQANEAAHLHRICVTGDHYEI
jgi:hypothetical protein